MMFCGTLRSRETRFEKQFYTIEHFSSFVEDPAQNKDHSNTTLWEGLTHKQLQHYAREL